MWMKIAAVIVVVLLVSTALYVLVLGKKSEVLTATITPNPAKVDAGKILQLTVAVKQGDTAVTSATLKWSLSDTTLGDFDIRSKATVNMAAGMSAGNGTVKCDVDYNGKTVTASAPLEVYAPLLDSVSVAPAETWVRFDTTQIFTAKGTSTVGQNLTGLTFNWTASGLSSSAYTIQTLNDTAMKFTAKSVAGNVTLNATATYHSVSKTGSGLAKVTEFLPTRTVEYRWYDLFNVPFGPWYKQRAIYYQAAGTEQIWSDKYPYIYEYWGDTAHQNLYLYSNLRLNISAVNLPNVNMSHPEFLPLFGTSTGGTAVLHWHMQYDDPAWVETTLGSSNNDGFVINLTANTTLDRAAAMAVTGMSSYDFDNFDSYWASHRSTLMASWSQWIAENQGNGKYDIYNSYDNPFTMLAFNLQGQKVGDKVVFTITLDSWGMEALMTKWLQDAFMPTGMYMEGFWMNATIGPAQSNIFITTAVEYGVYAFLGRNTYQPIWLWKPINQDYIVSTADHPISAYDPYAKNASWTYMNRNPGSSLFNTSVPYDVTPCCWNLSENESMSFTWPAGPQQFEVHVGVDQVKNVSSNMTISYAEPMPGDYNDGYLKNQSMVLDTTNRTLTYTGPIDFWHWSRWQNASNHNELKNSWYNMTYKLKHDVMLPESAPWVEFGMASALAPPHIDHFAIGDMDDLPLVGNHTSINVTAYDQYGRVFTGYTGTVHFSSNKSANVVLPADYTFKLADKGMHTIPYGIVYNVAGWFNVSVSDSSVATAKGWNTNIMAITTPQQIDHFTISIPSTVVAQALIDATVTAWNQYGRVFHEYTGTVNWMTNDTGDHELPANYTFVLADQGVHKFQGGVSWDDSGVFNLTVVDTNVVTARGTAENILVTGGPEIHYKIYDMFQDKWGPFWAWRWPAYQQDLILSNRPGNYSMIYYWNMGSVETIWAPYRLNITATNLSNVNMRSPMLMPVMDTNPIANASASVNVYDQYLYWNWWNNTWVPTWQNDPNWASSSTWMGVHQVHDGWYLGLIYNVTMNREAALQWLNMSLSTTVANWWASNGSAYVTYWSDWLTYQMNHVYDVYNAYDGAGSNQPPFAKITELPNGDVQLEIATINYGFEILTGKWFAAKGICPTQPYFENATISAQINNRKTNLSYDAVCQYSLKAVRANASAQNGSAWAWEALRSDYITSSPNHPYSDYDRYAPLFYMSWNAGDVWFGQAGAQDGYETTPGWFNLTKSETLTFELPKGNQVLAYLGQGVPQSAIDNITSGYPYGPGSLYGNGSRSDYREYDNMEKHGTMSLGFYITNLVPGVGAKNQPLNLNSMYDSVNKTLTIKGPHNFDNSGRGAGNPMYHGAPWIEFNVTYAGSTSLVASTPAPAVSGGSSAASDAVSLAEMAALMAVVLAVLAASVAVVVDMRRER